MKKKTFKLVVLLATLCTSIGMFTACQQGHTHDFSLQVASSENLASEATCTEKAKYYFTCECGEKGTLTFEHGSLLEHEFIEYVSDNNATYESDGTKTAVCNRDGCSETHTIVDEGSKLVSHVGFKTLSVIEKNVFANATEEFSFIDEMEIFGNATYVVASDEAGENTFETKIVPLSIGDNTFYVLEKVDGDTTNTYTVVLRRRPMYTVSFNSNGGSAVDSQMVEESFTATAPESNPTLTGYTFNGWDFDFSSAIIEDVEIDAKWTANTDTPYIVEYYQENIDDDGYTLVEEETENLTGTTNTLATAEIKDFEHFTALETVVTGNINADGSTVLKVYYSRNTYTLTLTAQDKNGTVSGAGTYKYGEEVTANLTLKDSCTFVGWYNGATQVSTEVAYTFDLLEDTTLVAKWEANYILASFNSEEDVDKVTSSKMFTELASGVVSEEAPSGALVAKANSETFPLDIKFSKTLVLDSTVDGIYIRMKTANANLYLGLLKADGSHYLGDGKEYDINKQFNNISTNPGKITGAWYTFYINKVMLIAKCGVTAESEIGGLRLYCHYSGLANFEIDEIGTYTYADVVDQTLATNVIADFDDDVYAGLAATNNIYKDSGNYNKLLLTKAEYEAVGATSGVLEYKAGNGAYEHARTYLPTTIKLAEVKYVAIKVKANKLLNTGVNTINADGLNLNLTATNGKTTGQKALFDLAATGSNNVVDAWSTIYLDSAKLQALLGADAEVNYIDFYCFKGCLMYIDEISVILPGQLAVDSTIAENVLADFDESLYLLNASVTNNYSKYPTVIDSTSADYATIGATSGCLKFYYASYSNLYLSLQKTVKVSETNGIMLRLYADKELTGANLRIALGSDGVYGAAIQPGLAESTWTDVLLTPSMISGAGYDLDTTYDSILIYSANFAYNLYIDSISIVPIVAE